MTILGHHGGLTDIDQLRGARREPVEDEALTTARLFEQIPEAREIISGSPLLPHSWRRDPLLLEMGVRMVFSALVDADHLDTAAHFQAMPSPMVAPPADMTELVRRFEEGRHKLLADRVQLFDSLFGRKPARSRKLHRLTNAVLVLDEVQALPVSLLVPILDALRLLTEHFGTTVLLTSATQPAFDSLDVWKTLPITNLVDRPVELFQRLRRARYEWWVDPKPELTEVAAKVAEQRQALVVVNTVNHARRMFRLLEERADVPVRHLSTRMCPVHRRAVLAEVRALLKDGKPVLLVSTQLIEAGVDVDFPVVFRALAPAESLQQAAGRANREGHRDEPGRVVVFDAFDTSIPLFYRTAVGSTQVLFGPDLADPDDVTALDHYYQHLYSTIDPDHGKRGRTIQERRKKLDFLSVVEGPFDPGLSSQRRSELAFRMIDDDTVPVAVTNYRNTAQVEALLDALRTPDGQRRETFRALRPYVVTIPQQIVTERAFASMCQPVIGELWEWRGDYDEQLGIDDSAIGEENVW